MSISLLLLTGFTSAFNCVALQMGLLGSTVVAADQAKKIAWWTTLTFLGAKLLAYTVLGFFLGAFGEGITLSEELEGYLELAAGTYVVLAALNTLGVHPILRYTVITPPRFVLRFIKDRSLTQRFFAPALLGVLTILIPCGTTVAVEALALGSANPLTASTIMLIFTLGTMPVFLGYGLLSSWLGERISNRRFILLEGIVVLSLGLFAIFQTLQEMGVI